jgi:hypothetical protein
MKVTPLTAPQQSAISSKVAAYKTAFATIQAASADLEVKRQVFQQALDQLSGLPGTQISDDGTFLVNQ